MRSASSSVSALSSEARDDERVALVISENRSSSSSSSSSSNHVSPSRGSFSVRSSRCRGIGALLLVLLLVVALLLIGSILDVELPISEGTANMKTMLNTTAASQAGSADGSNITAGAETRPGSDHVGAISAMEDDDDDDGLLLSHRISALDRDASFSFVHVSKCAGAAWIRLLKSSALSPMGAKKLFPQTPQGVERAVLVQRAQRPLATTLISIRSPRHHVWSLYHECRYGGWSPAKSFFKDAPGESSPPLSDEDGFERWLLHFVEATEEVTTDTAAAAAATMTRTSRAPHSHYDIRYGSYDYLRCYHPSNFQSRFLTTTNRHAQEVARPRLGGVDENTEQARIRAFEPDPRAAISNLRDLVDFVAINDFFHESKCLLYYRMLMLASSSLPTEREKGVHSYLRDTCKCPVPDTLNDVRVTHHKGGTRKTTMTDLKEDALEMVATLTRSDVAVFSLAVADFFHEIAWLESDSQLGRRVLCDETLESVGNELSYLGFNITDLYHRINRRTKG